MSKCKFEVGKTYKTQNGYEVLITYINTKNSPNFQIHGIVFREDGSSFNSFWNLDGNYLKDCKSESDLMPPEPEKKVIERWFNIYPSGNLGLFYSRKDADAEASRGVIRVACIYRELEYVVGEGLDE